jgi:hypothetical protein
MNQSRFWIKYMQGEKIKAHLESLECGFVNARQEKLDNIPFQTYCMKEPG